MKIASIILTKIRGNIKNAVTQTIRFKKNEVTLKIKITEIIGNI